MKKVILLMLVLVTILSANAQVFVENFATATINGNLEGYNDWYVSLKTTIGTSLGDNMGVSPKIGEGALFYTGYAGNNVGNVAILDSVIGIEDATKRISTRTIVFQNADTLRPIEGQKIYAAFLVNISTHSARSFRDFFTFEGSTNGSSTRGRLFAKTNTAGTDLTFALSKNSSSSTTSPYITSNVITNGIGLNNLIVMCYEGIAGSSNDIISVYINPDLSLTEAQQTNKLVATDTQSDYSVSIPFRINLRQRGIGAQIGGIRVGKSWDSVVLGINSGIRNTFATNLQVAGKTIITENAGNIRIYSLAGSEVLSATTEGRLDTNLPRGMYMIKFVDKSGITSTIKTNIN